MKRITTILLLLFITAGAMAQNVNISLIAPSDVGACVQNLYTINFTGAAAGTELRIVPSLNVAASGSCPTTDGVALEYVSSNNATLVSEAIR